MSTLSQVLIAFVILEHIYILWMEMFAWESIGKRTFRKAMKPDMFKPTKVLAANQGLYNGFLAAGLIWTFFIEDVLWQQNIAMFFLSCIIVAGIFGAATADKKIFFVQALPALITLVSLFMGAFPQP
jgi:putative membrane protein